MLVREAVSAVKKGAIPKTVVLWGDDAYIRKVGVREIVRAAKVEYPEMNLSIFEGRPDMGSLCNALERIPFASPTKAVVLRETDVLSTAASSELTKRLARTPLEEHTLFVISAAGKLDRRKEYVKELMRSALLVECAPLVGEALRRYLVGEAKARGLHLGRTAAEMLAERTQGDLHAAMNELDKLASVLEGQVTPEDVEKYTPTTPEADVFRIHDLFVSGRSEEAYKEVSALLDEDPAPMGFLSLMAGTFRQMLVARACRDANFTQRRTIECICQQMNVREWVAKRAYERASHFSAQKLRENVEAMSRIDFGAKQGIYVLKTDLFGLLAGLYDTGSASAPARPGRPDYEQMAPTNVRLRQMAPPSYPGASPQEKRASGGDGQHGRGIPRDSSVPAAPEPERRPAAPGPALPPDPMAQEPAQPEGPAAVEAESVPRAGEGLVRATAAEPAAPEPEAASGAGLMPAAPDTAQSVLLPGGSESSADMDAEPVHWEEAEPAAQRPSGVPESGQASAALDRAQSVLLRGGSESSADMDAEPVRLEEAEPAAQELAGTSEPEMASGARNMAQVGLLPVGPESRADAGVGPVQPEPEDAVAQEAGSAPETGQPKRAQPASEPLDAASKEEDSEPEGREAQSEAEEEAGPDHPADTSAAQGQRPAPQSVLDLMAIALCARICGVETLEGFADFARSRMRWVRDLPGLEALSAPPDEDAFFALLAHVRQDALKSAVAAWVDLVRSSEVGEGAEDPGQLARLRLMSAEGGIAFGRAELPVLLGLLDLHGATLVAGPEACDKDLLSQIRSRKAGFVIEAGQKESGMLDRGRGPSFFSMTGGFGFEEPQAGCRSFMDGAGGLSRRDWSGLKRVGLETILGEPDRFFLTSLEDVDAFSDALDTYRRFLERMPDRCVLVLYGPDVSAEGNLARSLDALRSRASRLLDGARPKSVSRAVLSVEAAGDRVVLRNILLGRYSAPDDEKDD